MWTIGEHATKDVVTVNGAWTAQECAEVLSELRIRHLPLTNAEGRPVGLVTDARVFGLLRRDLYDVPVRSVAMQPPLVLHEQTPLHEALTRMVTAGQDSVLLVDADGRLVGIFTEHDALRLAELSLRPWQTVGEVVLPNFDLYTAPLGTTFDDARSTMIQAGIRHLVVVHPDGRLAGVVSLRDVAGRERTTVDGRLHSPVETIGFDDDLHAAVSRMVRKKMGVLPVIDERGLPLGVLTRVDVIRALQLQLAASSDAEHGGEITQDQGPNRPLRPPART